MREGVQWCEGSPPAQHELFLELPLGWDRSCGTIWGHPSTWSWELSPQGCPVLQALST